MRVLKRLFVAFCSALFCTASIAAADDWPAFLGPQRNGTSRETGLNFNWPAAGPPIVWQTPLGTSYSAPAVSGGRLFHFDRYGDEDRLICRDAKTGDELWTLTHETDYQDMLGYNDGPRCSPVVDGDLVFTMSATGILQCVGASDGKRQWQVDTIREFGVVKNFFGVGGTPAVWNDVVIVNIGGSPPGGPADIYSARGNVRGNGTGVVAFDKLTGKVRWQATDELASYSSPVVTEIEGRPWCFVFARGGLVGLDPRTGKVEFEYPWRSPVLESVNASTPVVIGNEVFISETYSVGSSLLRVRPGGVDVVWKDDTRQRDKAMMLHWNTPVPHDGFLYGSSGRHSSTAVLRCVEWNTGKVRWDQRGLGRCSLLYADGHLVCLAEDGTLLVLRANPEKYDEVCSVVLEDDAGNQLLEPDAWTAPVLAGGLLYVRGSDRLVCLDLRK
jgi:outer membrane protein assembly factor BamB